MTLLYITAVFKTCLICVLSRFLFLQTFFLISLLLCIYMYVSSPPMYQVSYSFLY